MTNEHIEKLIDALNKGLLKKYIFRVGLSPRVEYARVWTEDPQGKVSNEGSYEFYFLKSETGKFFGAVLDMYNDLHVFLKKSFRGKGHLAMAMQNVILPHLHQKDGRTKQRVTFTDPEIGHYCERNWGFTITGLGEATRDLTTFTGFPPITYERRPLNREDFSVIKQRIDKARNYLVMVKEQVEASIGKSNTDLDSLISDLVWLDDEILSRIEDVQGQIDA